MHDKKNKTKKQKQNQSNQGNQSQNFLQVQPWKDLLIRDDYAHYP